MKTYNLIVTVLAIVGVALFFDNYPILVGIAGFGIGIGYKEYTQELKEKDQEKEDNIE